VKHQGMKWFTASLMQDEDGDVADQFFVEEEDGQIKAVHEDKLKHLHDDDDGKGSGNEKHRIK